jgi:dTDP-4-amino-4,6-dideoxygalactose transaminase
MKPVLRNLKVFYPHKAFYKVPYLIPPWAEPETGLFRSLLLNKGYICEDSFVEEVKKNMASGSRVYLLDSGRHAIKLLLKNAPLPQQSEIVVPVMCCNVIPKTIEECGFVPLFADVGADLCLTVESIEAAISPKTKGVILVHAGGAAASEYKEIIEFCKASGLYLIDNAAQAWGNEMEGIWLGGRGNAGIVSFGLGKSTFGLGGGMLVTNSLKIDNPKSRKTYSKPELIRFYLKYLMRGYTAPLFMFFDKCFPDAKDSNVMQASLVDIFLQYSMFRRLEAIIKRRTEISLRVKSILNNHFVSFPQGENNHVWTKLIVRLPEELNIRFQRYLYMKRIETEDYHSPHYLNLYWKSRGIFSESGYKQAEEMHRELLVLPNSPSLSLTQLEYLYRNIEAFKEKYL